MVSAQFLLEATKASKEAFHKGCKADGLVRRSTLSVMWFRLVQWKNYLKFPQSRVEFRQRKEYITSI